MGDRLQRLGFDLLAPWYDALAAAVYDDATHRDYRTHMRFLRRRLPPEARILIAGPGSGRGLQPLRDTAWEVAIIEQSAVMRRRCCAKLAPCAQVAATDLRNWQPQETYDAIVTPYVLDCFSSETMQRIWLSLHRALKPGGWWVHVDFQDTGRWHHRALLAAMYRCFRHGCGIEARDLPPVTEKFLQAGYRLEADLRRWRGFISAQRWRRPPTPRRLGDSDPDPATAADR